MVLGRVVSCPALSMWNRKRENTKETRDGLKLLDARARELFTRVTRVHEEEVWGRGEGGGGEYKTWWLSVSCNWRRVTSFHEAIRFLLNYSNFEPINRNGRALTLIINIGFSFWNVLSKKTRIYTLLCIYNFHTLNYKSVQEKYLKRWPWSITIKLSCIQVL